ncbi:hypothetical protein DSO57_1005629 [Entomophthora muscae]|uniref:Uncharacterized protein n=1 Tax=Entomophthora muscae TaxID=34485 RepID=A0ACC2SA10_9FUNG|nr:hypothetical protein DSO57_1005629 [Entomophthora muscae]
MKNAFLTSPPQSSGNLPPYIMIPEFQKIRCQPVYAADILQLDHISLAVPSLHRVLPASTHTPSPLYWRYHLDPKAHAPSNPSPKAPLTLTLQSQTFGKGHFVKLHLPP